MLLTLEGIEAKIKQLREQASTTSATASGRGFACVALHHAMLMHQQLEDLACPLLYDTEVLDRFAPRFSQTRRTAFDIVRHGLLVRPMLKLDCGSLKRRRKPFRFTKEGKNSFGGGFDNVVDTSVARRVREDTAALSMPPLGTAAAAKQGNQIQLERKSWHPF